MQNNAIWILILYINRTRLISSLENISINRVRYINIAERHWNTILSQAMWKIYHCGFKIEPGTHLLFKRSFGDLEFLSRFYAEAEHGEISLLSRECDCNVADKPISAAMRE